MVSGIGDNLRNAFQAATFLGVEDPSLFGQSNYWLHSAIAAGLPQQLRDYRPDLDDGTLKFLTGVTQLLASPIGGVLIGLAGPAISSMVAVANTVEDIAAAAEFEEALQILVAAPGNIVDGFLNGAALSLPPVPLTIADTPTTHGTLTPRRVYFGGLLTPGLTDAGMGGSIFNSLDIDIDIDFAEGATEIELELDGNPVGPLGALTNLSHVIAKAIGWDGEGNPLADLTVPTTPEPEPAPAVASESSDGLNTVVEQEISDSDYEDSNTDEGAVESKSEQITKPTLRGNPLNRLGNSLRARNGRATATFDAVRTALTASDKSETTKPTASEQKNGKASSKGKASDRRSAKKRRSSGH